MKKIIITLVFLLLISYAFGQVFNSGACSRGKIISLGLEPTVMGVGSGDNFMMFAHVDFKLKPGANLTFKYGAGDEDYFGGALKWTFVKTIAINAGMHKFGSLGLDASAIFSIKFIGDNRIYLGADMDINFPKGNSIQIPLWLPVGMEVRLAPSVAFALEAEIGVNDEAYHILGGGVIIYF